MLLGDREGAEQALAKGREIVKRAGPLSPWHLSGFRLAELLADVTAIEAGDRARLRQATANARRLLRLARKIAKERTETFHLVGRLAWLRGKKRQAEKWWARSIAEGQRLGARPELARAHLTAARYLSGEKAAEHERRGTMLLTELGLGDGRIAVPVAPAAARASA